MVSVNNIEHFRVQRGWSRPELGKLMKTSGQQVERLEKGQRKLTQAWIDKASVALGVEPSEIITKLPTTKVQPLNIAQAPDRMPTIDPNYGEVAEVIALDLSLSMGPGTLIEEMVEETPVKFDLGFLRRMTRASTDFLRIVRGIGDSMEPTVRSTDHVLIDTSEKTMSRIHGIYWIDVFGAHGLKRLRPAGGGKIWVISDNKEAGGEPFEVEADDLRIHGRAIWCGREL